MRSTQNWSLLLVGVAAFLVVAVIVFDGAKGGEARPGPYLGEAKGERYPYVPPTSTPQGVQPTAIARPTIGPGQGRGRPGDPNERDAKRRNDLLQLAGAASQFKRERGSLPNTNGNVQTLCAYKNLDVACAFEEILSPLPLDPLGSPVQNGYWYSSDAQRAKFYASLEVEIPEGDRCATKDAELTKRAYLICIETP